MEKETTQDDDDTVMTKITKHSSLENKEIEYNQIDDWDDEYDNHIIFISNQVIIRMSGNDVMNVKILNYKWKRKWKKKWYKYKYSRK